MPQFTYEVTNLQTGIKHIFHESDQIYYIVERWTGDSILAEDAASWAELATIGEVYTEDIFTLEIHE